ncbi:MAG TPA: hypothetical protein VID27_22145 [Blastocatellia bacterium]
MLTLTRLTEEGNVFIPDEYRLALSLTSNSPLVLLQVGDILLLAPVDEELASVTSRLEARLSDAGIKVEDLIAEASAVREEINRAEFGQKDQP